MVEKRFAAEQIIRKLREAEVEASRGRTTAEICRKLEISEQTTYRWRKVYGRLNVGQARKPKSLRCRSAGTGGSPSPATWLRSARWRSREE